MITMSLFPFRLKNFVAVTADKGLFLYINELLFFNLHLPTMSRGSFPIEIPPQAYLASEPTDEEWPGNGINPPDLLSRYHQVGSSVDQTTPRRGSQQFDTEHGSSSIRRHSDSPSRDSKRSSVLPSYETGPISDDRSALYNLVDPWEPSLQPQEEDDRTRTVARYDVPTYQEQTSGVLHKALWSDGLEYGNLIRKNDKVITPF